MFDPITMKLNVEPLIESALREDITNEDVSTNSVMPEAKKGEADLLCKQDGIICGLQIFTRVFTLLDPDTEVELYVKDGEAVKNGQLMAKVRGDHPLRRAYCTELSAENERCGNYGKRDVRQSGRHRNQTAGYEKDHAEQPYF